MINDKSKLRTTNENYHKDFNLYLKTQCIIRKTGKGRNCL